MSSNNPLEIAIGRPGHRLLRLLMVCATMLLLVQVEGCYYMQAARGQLDLLNKRRPLDEVIADQDSPDTLKARLVMVQEARQFSIDELLLPDNKSYQSYADLGRDYVVWNIFAAPEFSLQPKQWCYPVAGCVAYRGYFSKDTANRKAENLKDDGFDIAVGGVSAYSTLGKFSDPVLNTMMRWSDVQLVATLFHELAHQKLYIKGDTAFNESFATAVADFGIEKWLAKRGELEKLQERQESAELRRELMLLVDATKTELQELYASASAEEKMRAEKAQILDRLSSMAAEKVASSNSGGNWLSAPLNNARLASLGLYEGHLGAFRAMLGECGGQLSCFYERATEISDLDDDERQLRLQQVEAAAATQI